MRRILFVCTGNTCRSPMAEALFQKIAERNGLTVMVQSAGLVAVDGMDVSKQTLQVLKEKGIDYTGKSQSMREELSQWADLILTMTRNHKHSLISLYPESLDKIYTLKEYIQTDSKRVELTKRLDQIHTEIAIAEQENRQSSEIEELIKTEEQIHQELAQYIEEEDIQDPFGGDTDLYQHCAEELEQDLSRLVARLKTEEGGENQA